MKTCLIVSYGPVPTPRYQKIEGGGQRCWGLALGLKANGYDVTVAINNSFPLDTAENEGIHLINWGEDQQFAEKINTFDSVIMNYAMGGPMTFVVDNISDHVQLVLDCYVPIYIEVSARDSTDKVTEYSNYSHDIIHYNKALKRGDYFLCANIPQKHMYMGALSALGIINPYSYKTPRVLVVPFGVESSIDIANERNPYTELGIQKKDFTLLWFGGLYPWFNIQPLLNTIKRLSKENKDFKFVIVGGKNPYNQNPDFIKQYDTTYSYFKKNNLINKSVFFVDWVDFSDRINWYRHATVVISINNIGEENIYSWRTRVMDYVWGEIPMLTNGGDPLSDSLLTAGAAIRLESTEEEALYTSLSSIVNKPNLLKEAQKNLVVEKRAYYWEKVVTPLVKELEKQNHPYLDEKAFIEANKPDTTIELLETNSTKRKIKKLVKAPRKLVRMVKKKGVKRSVKVIAKAVLNRIEKTTNTRRQYYFFSHPVDHTGAPLVLLDTIEDFSKKINPRDINVLYPGGEKSLIKRLSALGVKLDKMVMGIGSRILHAQLNIRPDDFVLMNTVAIYPNYRDYVLGLLDDGRLKQATWFIHEDIPKLRFDDLGLIHRVKRLIAQDKLKIIVPSQQTANDYNEFFDTKKIDAIKLRVIVPDKYSRNRKASDYSKKIRFVISGTPSDGRKGQLLAISAFSKYLCEYYTKNHSKYRDFELNLIAIGKKGEDYISTQIRAIGDGLIGNKIHYYPKVSKDKALEITSKNDVTICCSLNETFALFVAEGMLMGHIILRNKTSGYKEQLKNGVNGYAIDEQNINNFAAQIEKVLNKSTADEALLSMGNSSKQIAEKFASANYFDQISSK